MTPTIGPTTSSLYVFGNLLLQVALSSVRAEDPIYLLMGIRNMLYSRAGYFPPTTRAREPGTVSEAELAQWVKELEAFNAAFGKAKEAGAEMDVNQEFEDAGIDLVLPAL